MSLPAGCSWGGAGGLKFFLCSGLFFAPAPVYMFFQGISQQHKKFYTPGFDRRNPVYMFFPIKTNKPIYTRNILPQGKNAPGLNKNVDCSLPHVEVDCLAAHVIVTHNDTKIRQPTRAKSKTPNNAGDPHNSRKSKNIGKTGSVYICRFPNLLFAG